MIRQSKTQKYRNTIRGRALHELYQARKALARAEAALKVERGYYLDAAKLRANLYANFVVRLEKIVEANG